MQRCNGLALVSRQWGYFPETSSDETSTFNVSYPLAFTNCYSVTTAPSGDDTANVFAIAATYFTARCHQSLIATKLVKRPFRWIAIGN